MRPPLIDVISAPDNPQRDFEHMHGPCAQSAACLEVRRSQILPSAFVNILDLPLIVLMFVAEHAHRMVHLRNPPRYTMSDARRMMGHIKNMVLKQASSD